MIYTIANGITLSNR